MSLLIFFPKSTFQRINNCFNLYSFDSRETIEEFNKKLNNYQLCWFQHRIMNKMFTFAHSFINNTNSPPDLHQVFKQQTLMNSWSREPKLVLPGNHILARIRPEKLILSTISCSSGSDFGKLYLANKMISINFCI